MENWPIYLKNLTLDLREATTKNWMFPIGGGWDGFPFLKPCFDCAAQSRQSGGKSSQNSQQGGTDEESFHIWKKKSQKSRSFVVASLLFGSVRRLSAKVTKI